VWHFLFSSSFPVDMFFPRDTEVQVQEACTPAWSAENIVTIHHTSPWQAGCAVTPYVQYSGKKKFPCSQTTKNDLAICGL
jgi:hypothetical protein